MKIDIHDIASDLLDRAANGETLIETTVNGTDKDGKYVVTVTNFSPLPETGGNGTLLFVMLGVLMLALGTAWYLRANRMEPAAAGGAGAGTALPVGRKRGRHTR